MGKIIYPRDSDTEAPALYSSACPMFYFNFLFLSFQYSSTVEIQEREDGCVDQDSCNEVGQERADFEVLTSKSNN